MWKRWFGKSILLVLLSFSAVIAIAETRTGGLAHTIQSQYKWNSSSWVWVFGAVLFLVALIAVLRISTKRVGV